MCDCDKAISLQMTKNLPVQFAKHVFEALAKGNFSAFKNIKYYNRWKSSLQQGRNSIVDEQPWITFPVIDFIIENVNHSSRVFEYGGGGSTLFFMNHAKEVVTVEHDRQWFTTLEQIIASKKLNNWTGQFILPEMASTHSLNPSNPNHYYTDDKAFKNFTFKAYASSIDHYTDEHFDFVLVDGRSRPSCIQHSISKIKRGGYLIVDNSDREYYFTQLTSILQNDFRVIYNKKALSPYVDFITQTGIWQKHLPS